MPAIGQGRGPAFSTGSIGFKYLSLPGASGDYASTPDSSATSITGDLDIRVKASLDDWSGASEQELVAKSTATGDQRGYRFAVSTTGSPTFYTSTDGLGFDINVSSSVSLSLVNGATKWVRVAYDVDSGSGNYLIRFYTSDDGMTWAQLGTDRIGASVGTTFDNTAVLEVGSVNAGTSLQATGKVFQARVYNGIDGTLAVQFNAQDADVGDSSFTSVHTGETWTVNGTAAIDRL